MTQIAINTTQNVQINFTAAGVGDRILAYLLDLLIKIAYGIVIYGIFFYLLGINNYLDSTDQWSMMATILFFALPIIFYTIVLESIFEGQTVGKKLLKIKVVKIDGYQATFAEYLIRWFMRIIDISLFNGIIALIVVSSSKNGQRLGDMVAGTSVITLKNNVTISSTILEDIGNEYVPIYPLVIKLSDNDVRIIKEAFLKAEKRDDFETIDKIKAKIETVTGIKNQSGRHIDFIRTILKDYNYYTQSM
ncbi:MAG: RDD family protein [Flavobacterium sp.]|uniref:RDD family protein n=1 Tax=Flavobacterium sp. TaxID=239 RepID=UPI0022C330CD|nr:RDD family protein [Flavobacterium sp.]MCZ8198766.1 RDD family protein [Flavobacterium sp.]